LSLQFFGLWAIHGKTTNNYQPLKKSITHMTNQEIQERIKILSNQSAYPSVSILFPLHEEGRFTVNTPEHTLKVLMQETYQRLGDIEDDQAIQQIKSRLDSIAKNMNFGESDKSVGIFVSPEHEEVISLPFPVSQNVFIGDNFQIRDLVQARNRLQEYVVLMISQKKILTLRGAGQQLSVIEVPEMPTDMATQFISGNALDTDEIVTDQVDTSIEREAPSDRGNGDQRAWPDQSSIQGVVYDEKVRPYMDRIDNAIGKYLGNEGLQVVLIGVEKVIGHYKKFSKNQDKVIGTVHGNYEVSSPQHIAELAWPLVQQKLEQDKAALLNELDNVSRTLYSGGLVAVWRAAFEGRVRTLIVEDSYQARAAIQDEGYSLILDVAEDYSGPDKVAEDAVDDLIELVFSRAGQVVFVNDGELEKHQRVAAICRY
jgi:hypothetical protein